MPARSTTSGATAATPSAVTAIIGTHQHNHRVTRPTQQTATGPRLREGFEARKWPPTGSYMAATGQIPLAVDIRALVAEV